MSYTYLDGNSIQIREIVSIPTIGGLDLSTDKLNVHPGSLQSCMNYEVGKESGYRIAPGLLRYNGTITYLVKKYLTANLREVSASINDIYPGGEYVVKSSIIDASAIIKVLNVDAAAGLIHFQLLEGNWALPIYQVYITEDEFFYETSDNKYYAVRRD